jgi:hypothetical protein
MSDTVTMRAGTTKQLNFAVTSNAVAVDITSQSFIFMATNAVKDLDAAALISKSVGSGITITDGAGGLLKVIIVPTDTNTFPLATTNLYATLRFIEGANVYDVWNGVLTVDIGAVQAIA